MATTPTQWRDAFALGVMVVPSNRAYRIAARATWLPEAQQYATVRWVAGDVPCARTPLEDEAREHGDVVFVDSEDCEKWHSPAKVHAWYGFALRHFPAAAWVGKMEDDGLCAALPARPRDRADPSLRRMRPCEPPRCDLVTPCLPVPPCAGCGSRRSCAIWARSRCGRAARSTSA